MDEKEVVTFTACKHLSFDRSKFVPSARMNLINYHGETKVVWDRQGIDRRELCQFCNLRGRMNNAWSGLGKKHACCSDFEEVKHEVPLKDIDLE